MPTFIASNCVRCVSCTEVTKYKNITIITNIPLVSIYMYSSLYDAYIAETLNCTNWIGISVISYVSISFLTCITRPIFKLIVFDFEK